MYGQTDIWWIMIRLSAVLNSKYFDCLFYSVLILNTEKLILYLMVFLFLDFNVHSNIITTEQFLFYWSVKEQIDVDRKLVSSFIGELTEKKKLSWLKRKQKEVMKVFFQKHFKRALGCLMVGRILSQVSTHQGPILELVYPWYTNT